jgi:hypothetical protein
VAARAFRVAGRGTRSLVLLTLLRPYSTPMTGVAQRIPVTTPTGADAHLEPVTAHDRAVVQDDLHGALDEHGAVGHDPYAPITRPVIVGHG